MRAWAVATGLQPESRSASGITPARAHRLSVAGVPPAWAATSARVSSSSLIALQANNGGTSDVAPPLRGRIVPRRRPATQSSASRRAACTSHYPACCQFQAPKSPAAGADRQYPIPAEESQVSRVGTVGRAKREGEDL